MALLAACFFARAQEPDTVATFNLDKSVITEETKKPLVLNSRGISGQINTEEYPDCCLRKRQVLPRR